MRMQASTTSQVHTHVLDQSPIQTALNLKVKQKYPPIFPYDLVYCHEKLQINV